MKCRVISSWVCGVYILANTTFSPVTAEEISYELFSFVGKKTSIVQFEPKPVKTDDGEFEEIFLDVPYMAKYQIVQKVHGTYSKRHIEFEMYTHWGEPQLPQGKHSLMFVWLSPERNISVKYLYFTVHKTKNGRWASCGDPFLGYEGHKSHVTKIRFRRRIEYSIVHLTEE